MKQNRKTSFIIIRVTEAEKKSILAICDKNTSISDYVRSKLGFNK